MGRKYLEDLGIESKDTPWGWNKDDDRQESWCEQIKEYGFNEKDTWSLDYTMNLLLYERLCMYKELASEVVDLDFHIFKFNGKEITQRQCIDAILEGLKYELTLEPFDKKRENKVIKKKIDNIWKIYDLCKNTLWW